MTRDELVAKVALAVPAWGADRFRNFLELTPDEQALEAQMLADSAEGPGVDGMALTLAILKGVLTVAEGVTGVTGAISGIQAVVKG